MVRFGQCVIGPPGSGKTSYCAAMAQYLEGQGRKFAIVNLDPANDELPYTATVNLADLIKVADVMQTLSLGPNGALVYCVEYLEKNVDWLLNQLNKLSSDTYILLDCPGQVELYTHHSSIRDILHSLQREEFRFTVVHLVDGHYCSDPGKYISILLSSLSMMINIEMPHINVLSKFDLVDSDSLAFDSEYYAGVMDLDKICDLLCDDPFMKKNQALSKAIAGVVENYALVGFHLLNIKDKKTLKKILSEADKGNGWMFGQATERMMEEQYSSRLG
ncbi:GPN-loop GTPase 2 [Galendromus occidentalis]|uniref:GPN-loop GTPase 2 n=1 Tax=Galendromus occidentalis TaxID=34638 RepID=A0AAJ7L8H5_9ACAR|nr:GPN-loop GTPase 2 [Galendromus occidentalis]XP_018497167.1 GPN-loop GTPase 2 [Galendromus occidentalis]